MAINKGTLQACRFETGETMLTTQCVLRAESGAIAKVLSVHGTADLTGKEVMGGEVAFDGTLTCRMLYIDGEGARKVLIQSCPFGGSIKLDIVSTDPVMLSATVSDIATVKVETDSVTLKGMVEVRAFAAAVNKTEIVTDCGEGLYGKTEMLTCYVPVGQSETVVEVACEKEIDADGDILTLETQTCITSLTPRVDGAVAEGVVGCNAVYRSTDGQLKNTCFTTTFCEEVPLAGINGDASLFGAASVKSAKAVLTRADGVPTAVKITAEVCIQVLACMPSVVSVVTDAFCPGKRVECAHTACECGKTVSRCVSKNIEGTAELTEGMPALDQVLGVTAVRISVAGVYTSAKTTVEGVLNAAVLYYNKEYGTTNSVAVEIPYSVTVDLDIRATRGTAAVCDINAKSLRSGKIDLAAEVKFELTETKLESVKAVTQIDEFEMPTSDEAGITVWRATASLELWDVAKGLNVAPESIMIENPELSFPTLGGEKVVLYRQLKI